VQKYLRPSIWQMQPIQVDFSLANKHSIIECFLKSEHQKSNKRRKLFSFKKTHKMWSFQNSGKIIFGPNQFHNLDRIIAGQKCALITYSNSPFNVLAQKLQESAGTPTLVINNVAANPDY